MSAVDDHDRSNNFIIYGAGKVDCDHIDEHYHSFENLVNVVNQMFNNIGVYPKPQILAASRIGTNKPGAEERPRLIKVTLPSPETVKFVLSNASHIRNLSNEY